jgi:hypothetical protein
MGIRHWHIDEDFDEEFDEPSDFVPPYECDEHCIGYCDRESVEDALEPGKPWGECANCGGAFY